MDSMNDGRAFAYNSLHGHVAWWTELVAGKGGGKEIECISASKRGNDDNND